MSAPPAAPERRPLLGLIAAMAAWGVFWGAWGALLPEVKQAVGASEAAFGAALLAIAAGALPALVVTGRVLDRFGDRALRVILVAFAVACALPGFAGSLPVLVVTLVLLGATSGALDVALNWGLATVEAQGGKRVFNAAHAAFPLGVVVAAPAAGAATELGAEPGPVLLLVALAGLLVVPLNGGLTPGPRVGEGVEGGLTAVPRTRPFRPTLALVAFGVVAAAVLLVENAVEQWSALHLRDNLGAGPAVGGLGPAAYMGALFLGRVVAQGLASRSGGRATIAVAGGGAAAGLALAALAQRPVVALAGFALAGFATAAAVPALFSAAGASATESDRGASVSAVTAISYAGYLASPPLVGAIAGAADLRAAWWALAAVGVAILLSSPLLPGMSARARRPASGAAPPRG